MFITIHCGGMPLDGNTIKKQALGGSETAAYYVAKELADRGHRVTMFTACEAPGEFDGVRYMPMGKRHRDAPLGENFEFYAANTPQDVLIIQRHPNAFARKYASNQNYLWFHDLALHRYSGNVNAQMVNIDGVLVVSEWHKNQVCDVYGINPDVVHVIGNGIDLGPFATTVDPEGPGAYVEKMAEEHGRKSLLFAGRPERGLEELVRDGGVMERLAEADPSYHLYICGYENTTPQMAAYYNYLMSRVKALPNITHLGGLAKRHLYDVMRVADSYIYPTSFEDTSCIIAMECAAAGLPFFAFNTGALPETTRDGGAVLLDIDGEPDLAQFVEQLLRVPPGSDAHAALIEAQREIAPRFAWSNAVDRLERVVADGFADRSHGAALTELLRLSDYYAAQYYAETRLPKGFLQDPITQAKLDEMRECYAFTEKEVWDEHYEKYYEYEAARGVEYGPEDVTGTLRYRAVAGLLSGERGDGGGGVPAGGVVLDYGCAHGHYTINLARQFPDRRFVGIDITASNIEKARKWAADEDVGNVEFYVGRVEDGRLVLTEERAEIVEAHTVGEDAAPRRDDPTSLKYDAVLAAEVLEHVADPQGHIEALRALLKKRGLFVATTPYGPWEAQGFKQHWPWRAHVHHFEREDLHEMCGHFKNFGVMVVPQPGATEPMGSYVWHFRQVDGSAPAKPIDYERKLCQLAPRQTVTQAMIVRDAANTIRNCLQHVLPLVDELVIGLDEKTTDETRDIIVDYLDQHWPEVPRTIFDIKSPVEIGFDVARNEVIAQASGDWVLWIDADEEVHVGSDYFRELRRNQFNGYAVQQHHFAIDPPQVLQTDLPCKLFRNHRGVRFTGKVHEHPEVSLNKGLVYVYLSPHVRISHPAYVTEGVRRGRFDRNFGLLERDREENPDRILGKMLMLRDRAQQCQQIAERTGGQVTEQMVELAADGVRLFEELLNEADVRMLLNALEFYSACAQLVGSVFHYHLKIGADVYGGEIDPSGEVEVRARFCSRDHLDKLLAKINDERLKIFGSRYM